MKTHFFERMKNGNLARIFVVLFFVASSLILFTAPSWALSTDTVAATVTPRKISVTLTSSKSISYGMVDLSSTAATTGAAPAPGGETQTAQNDGNVTEDFNITSTNATGGTSWTLAGTIGTNQYKHSFCTATCDSTPTWIDITSAGGYVALAGSIATTNSQDFDMRISTPSDTGGDYVAKSITITVQAVLDV